MILLNIFDVIGTVVDVKDMANFWTTVQGKALDCFTSSIYGLKLSKYFSVNELDAANFTDRFLYDKTFSDASYVGLAGSENGFYNGWMWENETPDNNYQISLYWDYPLP